MNRIFCALAFSSSIFAGNVFFEDCDSFYSVDSLKILAPTALACAISANSPIDQRLFDLYDQNIDHNDTKDVSKIAKVFGCNKPLSIAFFTSITGSYLLQGTDLSNPLFNWAFSSFRAVTVAMPTLILLQNVTGADRPWQETSSYYQPFKNDHGVSGHAFMGSIPFITAAMMVESSLLKAIFYSASTLTGWSRLNDQAHYPSQIVFGWMLGFTACNSIQRTNIKSSLTTDGIALSYYF